MIKSLIYTTVFASLIKDIARPYHAYLFYGRDDVLNVELAKVFIASIYCGKPACFECEACKRMEIDKNPDVLVLNKTVLQVADVEAIIDSVQLKPMIYPYKVVLITNAEGMNESAQNKLLKTLEEPNPQVIFVLVCNNIEKLLPTIRSRLSKRCVNNINLDIVREELGLTGVEFGGGVTLTDAIQYAKRDSVEMLQTIENSIYGLRSTADIPRVVSQIKLSGDAKKQYLSLLLKAVNCAISGSTEIFNDRFIKYLVERFNIKVLAKMLTLIDDAIRKLTANVNFSYILDNLFYNILKEKYLCR